jgi:hypothetical protein
VQVFIKDAKDLAGFEFEIEYDHALLRVTGITLSDFLGKPKDQCAPDTARCVVVLGPVDQIAATSVGAYTYGAGPGATGDSLLAVIHLQSLGAGQAILRLSNALVADVAANSIAPTTENATLVLK